MNDTLDFAIQIIRQTGDMLRDCFSPGGMQATRKPDHSVVTEADLAADRLITQAIHERYPDDAILSEELHSTLVEDAPATWVIDPLDGTTNYSLGLPFWGVSIARLVDGWPDTAALYFPLLNELYTAQCNSGAHFNDKLIRVKPPDPNQPAAFFACCSRTFRNYQVSIPFKARILGSATYTLCAVARGVALLGFEATPKIWDIAGGWLVLQEAGGLFETLDGSVPFPLNPETDFSQRSYPTLAAATPELMAKARQQINRK